MDLIETAWMSYAKLVDTPMGLKVKYGKNSGEPVSDPILYRTLVDYHIYLQTVEEWAPPEGGY